MANDVIPKSFINLPEGAAWRLIQGRESILMAESKKAEEIREDIGTRSCPKCHKSLTPTTSRDPLKIFKGPSVQLIGQCVPCGYREDGATV